MPSPEIESALGEPRALFTDPLLGKGMPAASRARAAAQKMSAQTVKLAPTAPRRSPAASETAGAEAPVCDRVGASGTPRKARDPGPKDGPKGGARAARARKAPARSEDAEAPGAALGRQRNGLAEPAGAQEPLPDPGPQQPAAASGPPATLEASGALGKQRKARNPGPKDGPKESARGARARKAAVRAEDAEVPGAARSAQRDGLAEPAESQEQHPDPGPQQSAAASGLPLCRARSFRSVRERRPLAGPADGPRGWKARPVLELLKLRSEKVSEAATAVNRVVNSVLRGLQVHDSTFKGIQLLNAGSYYERVKVLAPDEFDVMFKLEVPRTELVRYKNSAAFCFVKLKRNPKGNALNAFLEDGFLSASMMLSRFREAINKEILKSDGVTMEEEKIGSPAVTLILKPQGISVDIILALEIKSSWPESTQEGLPIHQWLGRKVRTELRREPFYLVAKPAKEGEHYEGKTWRLSFSNIEKKVLNNHGEAKTCCESEGVKCCRKDCLKLMKCLLEQLKREFDGQEEMEKFCSYHVKTAFFYMCSKFHSDNQWLVSDLELCFENFVRYFLQCLRNNQLPHYFIPEFNLFSEDLINRESGEFLHKKIEYEINNGFPIFSKLKI